MPTRKPHRALATFLWAVAFVTMAVGSIDPIPDDTGDSASRRNTEEEKAPPAFDIWHVRHSYDAESWSYHIKIQGFAESVTLNISQDATDPWEEQWDVPRSELNYEDQFDIRDLVLEIVPPGTEVQHYQRHTQYEGTPEAEAGMIWRVMATSEDGQRPACVVWYGEKADPARLMLPWCEDLGCL